MTSNNTTLTEEETKLLLAAYVNSKLQQMQEDKAERLKDVEPKWITRGEFFEAVDKDIRAVLNKLFNEKKIRVHKTIHAPVQDFVEYIGEQENE